MQGVIDNLIAGLFATALIFVASRLWKLARNYLASGTQEEATLLPTVGDKLTSISSLQLPEGLSPLEKIVHIEHQRDEAWAQMIEARSRGEGGGEHAKHYKATQECLNAMSFLEEGDVFDGGYTLLSFVGGGRTSVVWKAYSKQQDRFVAVKILRHSYLDDESIYRQFHYTARVMGELSAASIAAVREEVRQIEVNGARKLVYYVLEYIEGDSLDTYSAAHPERREKLIDGLLAVGDCIADAHAKGIVHRDLKPSNIIVDTSGRLRLVDFDSVLRLGDRRISHHDVGTFGYSAPEVLEGAVDPDVRADIFALGRVFSYLYYGRSLPSAYALSVYDLIDLLNCTPAVKSSLERACAVSPSERYATMTAFLEELQTAIREDRERALPAIATLRRERPKIARLLRHSFYGTLAAMIVARPILAHFNVVHLSDKASVGAFHGIIGSLVWGTFISGAFILYLVLLGRRMRTSGARYIAASLCCGIGGLLGGVLVSVPSVFVTNQYTLTCLGWLTDMNAPRLGSALLGTRMMLSFPLVGTLTGLGLGLCLVRGISIALRLNPQGSGILPVPAKRSPRSPEAGASLASPLLSSLLSHLFLAFPVILSFLIVLVFNAPNPADPSCSFQPNVNLRTFGEGVVHYLGAIGLTIGFFRGVRAGGST